MNQEVWRNCFYKATAYHSISKIWIRNILIHSSVSDCTTPVHFKFKDLFDK